MLKMPSSNDHNDAMSLLGTFLLQGWVMTDEMCSEEDCPVPIMRSKDGAIKFCVNHDPLPTSNTRNTKGASEPLAKNDTETEDDDDSIVVVKQEPTTTSDSDEFRLQQDRREQSSKASQLIGQRMLQRWVLLNEICPNEACYAIPLVRHPSNKTLYCVNCEQSYQSEKDLTQPTKTEEPVESLKSKPVTTATLPLQEELVQQNPIHSPLGSPAVDRSIKRQKKTETVVPMTTAPTSSTSVQNSREATNRAVQCLSTKMTDLTTTLQRTTDPDELNMLFQALEGCAKALNACATAMNTCHHLP